MCHLTVEGGISSSSKTKITLVILCLLSASCRWYLPHWHVAEQQRDPSGVHHYCSSSYLLLEFKVSNTFNLRLHISFLKNGRWVKRHISKSSNFGRITQHQDVRRMLVCIPKALSSWALRPSPGKSSVSIRSLGLSSRAGVSTLSSSAQDRPTANTATSSFREKQEH